MDPLLLFAAEFWWTGPVVVAGGGAAAVATVRARRRHRARTLEYAAAKHELVVARLRLRAAKAQSKHSQAALLVAKSARQGGTASAHDVERARRILADAQREVRAAQTGLKGRRVQVQAARAMLGSTPKGDENLPLPRLMAAHDAVVVRWMRYETDPARAIAFPAMSDATSPATTALLDAFDRARWLRPSAPTATMTPSEFAQYRGAVSSLEAAFATAEAAAWRAAGTPRGPESDRPADAGAWTVPPQMRDAWDGFLRSARSAAASAASAAADATIDAMSRATRKGRTDDETEGRTDPPRG